MENTKYRLTEESTEITTGSGLVKLYRIEALRAFGDVEEGEVGGWVEDESNLSFEEGDTSWIYDESKVYGQSVVLRNSKVWGNSDVSGNSKVSGSSVLSQYSYCEDSVLHNSSVSNSLFTRTECRDSGGVNLVSIDSCITGASAFESLFTHSIVENIVAYQVVFDEANILSSSDFLEAGPVGLKFRKLSFYKGSDGATWRVSCGCFKGTLDEFRERIKVVHIEGTRSREEYMATIEYVDRIIKAREAKSLTK